MTKFVDEKKLAKLNEEVYQDARVDRSHLLEFLKLVNTNDAKVLIAEVKKWLESLHEDSKYTRVVFPTGDLDAVIGDLDSYGRLQPDTTILEYKEKSNKTLPIS